MYNSKESKCVSNESGEFFSSNFKYFVASNNGSSTYAGKNCTLNRIISVLNYDNKNCLSEKNSGNVSNYFCSLSISLIKLVFDKPNFLIHYTDVRS